MKKLLFVLTLATGFFISSCSDPCKDITCSEVGTCDDGTCTCDTGYTGDNCETEIRAKFIGTWFSDAFTCDGFTESETFFVVAGTNISEVLLSRSADPSTLITGTVNDNVVTITDFEATAVALIFNGTLTLNNDEIVMDLQLTDTDTGGSFICSGTATRQ